MKYNIVIKGNISTHNKRMIKENLRGYFSSKDIDFVIIYRND